MHHGGAPLYLAPRNLQFRLNDWRESTELAKYGQVRFVAVGRVLTV